MFNYQHTLSSKPIPHCKGPFCVCRHTPEWVVKVCMYFFTGTPMALDIDAAGATVTSSRSKGKYGEHLQPQDKRRLYEAL